MADKTGISWADATWNPVVGCAVVSPGCTNCYAMRDAARVIRCANGANRASHYEGLVEPSKAGPVWTGKVARAPDHILTKPLSWRKPRRVFVNSMGDLFHESVPDEWIDRVFAIMVLAPQHTFQVLTKRARRMQNYCRNVETPRRIAEVAFILMMKFDLDILFGAWPLPNVWLGVTAEDQTRANERIPDLLATPAALRFVSVEPMLGPVDLRNVSPADKYEIDALNGYDFDQGLVGPRLDWVICGGESGPDARPMHPDWARSLRDQCKAARAPFFFKQWGEWHPCQMIDSTCYPMPGHAPFDSWTTPVFDDHPHDGWNWHRLGARRAGHLLDGREHHEFPVWP